MVAFGPQPNTGSYNWVPSGNLAQGRYRVLITYSPPSQNLVTAKSGVFRIRQPAIPGIVTLLSPMEAENLEAGTNYT